MGDSKLLDHIKRLEDEIKILKGKKIEVEEEAPHMAEEGDTEQHVGVEADSSGDDKVPTNTEKGKEIVVYNPTSSIVKTVQKRTDRMKKKKHPDFITPPKRKSKRHVTEVVDQVF